VRQPQHAHPGAFYEVFPPEQARGYVRRIEFCYTPKHGSWLNIAENELSSMTRQCLHDRRIGEIEELREEIGAWSIDVTDAQRGVWKAPAGLETTILNTTGVVDDGPARIEPLDVFEAVLLSVDDPCSSEFPQLIEELAVSAGYVARAVQQGVWSRNRFYSKLRSLRLSVKNLKANPNRISDKRT
jgi:hypothetical protein